MIVVYLQGGLGNQMFQYAFGKSLAKQTGRPLYFDLSHFDSPKAGETPRNFQLDQWKIECSFGTPALLEEITRAQNFSFFERVRNKIFPLKRLIEINDNTVLDVEKWKEYHIILLKGYFQNQLYFQAISSELRAQYIPRISVNAPFSTSANTVSVHVRRGDYISNSAATQHHGVTGLDFFKKAFSIIQARISQPHYIIFSDDIEWCKSAFEFLDHKTFIEPRQHALECEDVFWMSRCAHHIISNSSYSWWGAWLNSHPDKIVVCPAQWVASQTTAKNNVAPSEWIQL